MTDQIRRILAEHGRMSVDALTLAEDADLYRAGMTSLASVNVMLALESAFDLSFPIACSNVRRSKASLRSATASRN